jgi:flagellar biosynthesis protein FlhF
MSHETKTFRGPSLEELLPQIRAELGPGAVITRRRDGVVGGVGGFFGRRCVEVEARAGERPTAAAPARALPPRQIFDAYDADRAAAAIRADDLENPVVKAFVNGSAPFADHLQAASEREEAVVFADAHAEAAARAAGDAGAGGSRPSGRFEALDLGDAEEADEEPEEAPRRRPSRPSRPSRSARRADEEHAVCDALVDLGLPEPVVAALAREIEQNLQPFAPAASYAEQMRRALAGHIRVKYGWRTKQRTLALVGPPAPARPSPPRGSATPTRTGRSSRWARSPSSRPPTPTGSARSRTASTSTSAWPTRRHRWSARWRACAMPT